MPLEVERAAPPSPPPKAVSIDDSAPSPQRAASSAGRSPGTPERHYSDSTTPGSTAPVLPGLMVSMPSAGFERQAVSKAKFVSYDVLVQVDGHRWVVHRRYTDFCALADGIRHLGDLPPKLPGKRTFGNFKDDFIEARRGALEAYLQGVVENDETRAQTVASPASPAAAARADAAPRRAGDARVPRRADPPAREPRLLPLRHALRPLHVSEPCRGGATPRARRRRAPRAGRPSSRSRFRPGGRRCSATDETSPA